MISLNTATLASGTPQPGDIVKIKHKDKTRSPYSTVMEADHDKRELQLMPFDAPGNGNRQARRAKYASERKRK